MLPGGKQKCKVEALSRHTPTHFRALVFGARCTSDRFICHAYRLPI